MKNIFEAFKRVVILIIILVVLCTGFFWGLEGFNQYIASHNQQTESLREVDLEIKRIEKILNLPCLDENIKRRIFFQIEEAEFQLMVNRGALQ